MPLSESAANRRSLASPEFCVQPLGHHRWARATTWAAESVRADFERREPRCRICRDESVCIAVNGLLDWRGVPIIREGGNFHRITLAEILRSIEPLNEGRDARDRITYDSLWIHSQRHYSFAGKVAYWNARVVKDFRNALLGEGV
ncbi:hypothetical protein OG921_15895 [Aldersonia sp. NBC_00410]|uniref:hypothetical protein n=1 Tax=Aldersonia sp. NBC_00410 TaxID=2975954 RepID=UPI0022595393|nr:hypothetical protein [Aldersonia sp. NBC_00410]MCX5044651.1 hypothetical protein [Aldersonia sp. NBC_00410]